MRKILASLVLGTLIVATCIRLYAQCTVTLPSIVYSNSWLGQTATIGSSTVFTTSATGLYRINIAGNATGVTNADIIGEIKYGSQFTLQGGAPANYCWSDPAYGPQGQTCTAEIQSGQAVTFDTRNLVSGTTYDMYVTIEKLQ